MNLMSDCKDTFCATMTTTTTIRATTTVATETTALSLDEDTFLFDWNLSSSMEAGGGLPSPSTRSPPKPKALNDYLWIYASPIIFLVGVVGNSLTLAVMTQKRLRGSTTAVYMPVIAALDTLALLTGVVPEWLEACGFLVFNRLHPWTCKLEKFAFYTTSDAAIWALILFTGDRLIAVRFPLRKTVICVPRRAAVACAVAASVCAAKNLHVFWTRGAVYHPNGGSLKSNCGRPAPYEDFELHVRPWIALAFVNAVPFAILIASNSVIIWTLAIVKRVSLGNKTAGGGGGEGGGGDQSRRFNQTTMMCLSASFAFLVCVTPSMVTLIGRPRWTRSPNRAYDVAKAVNNQLAYLNHAVNFFLYCLTGQKFRDELVGLVCRRSKRGSMVGEPPSSWLSYFTAEGRYFRKGVARGLASVKKSVIRPLAAADFRVEESEI